MSMIANEVALSQLKKALDVLEAPHDKLPKVTDKNGNEVTDAREKRLQLVGEYVQNAGTSSASSTRATPQSRWGCKPP